MLEVDQSVARMNWRAKILDVSGKWLIDQLKTGRHKAYDVIKDAVPPDAVILGMQWDAFKRTWQVIIGSSEFPEIEEGSKLEHFTTVCQTVAKETSDDA